MSQAVFVTAYGHEVDRSTWCLLWDVAESPLEHSVPAEPVPRTAPACSPTGSAGTVPHGPMCVID